MVSFLSNTTTSDHVVEADFGSKEAYQTYLQLKNQGADLEQQTASRELELNRQIREREAELNRQLREREAQLNEEIIAAQNALTQSMLVGGVLQYGIDKQSMEQAISCLTSASAALTQLQVALNIRQSQATNQIEVCKNDLEKVDFLNLHQILGFLEDFTAGIVQKQFLSLESSRQTFTIQGCRRMEQSIQNEIALALSNSATNPNALQQITDKLGAYLPGIEKKPEELLLEKLVDDVKLLELTQGNLS